MTESELRLECLRLATSLLQPANTLEQARAFFEFISPGFSSRELPSDSSGQSRLQHIARRSPKSNPG